ncbi:cysteine desulfurase [Photobacterium kishitanii]|uniref:Cysteine desulfurase-like protein n=1 Tax=Photobacterium kishitanii TaxID=318456 RepID=A0AAX0YPA1_9GAMM|nr:cysteine desulfurase-like protein [Photobacterium kishitanii]KJG07986.1 cysteine desulfurase [Photobacterium kishitanii]KJG55516.1 cysteine desulfurase [Photobacterium kishitanii]KJG58198.1 cysteine desulfurase [Photobacterium kishitanii]KJG63763.1 cysteine desulfurase [Photobacterium kishitanii]KJG66822.1 cysteine desulfurase [Photobacterium kishitanii]
MAFDPFTKRLLFPALNRYINKQPVCFFDGPGGSQVPQSVLDAMSHYLSHFNSNLGGAFFSSTATTSLMANAREVAQAFVNAPSINNMVFGANMTSLTFQLSRIISRDWQAGDEIIVTALDHYSNVSSWQQAAEDKGVIVHQVRLDDTNCDLDYDHFSSLLNSRTKLVAVTYASNVTGSLIDMKRIITAAHAIEAQVYVDAVHYAPHCLIDVQELDCDFLVCSAYKFFGPHLGIAYIAPQWIQTLRPYKVEPAPNNGPARFETGTQNFEALAGFIAAVNYLADYSRNLDEQSLSLRQHLSRSFKYYQIYEGTLSQYFLSRLNRYSNVKLFGLNHHHQRTPTFAIRINNVEPAEVAAYLAKHNICIWHGHFYAQGLCEQLNLLNKGGVIRIGCMHYNTFNEIDTLFSMLDCFLTPK